jgi:intein/homing endonuclease
MSKLGITLCWALLNEGTLEPATDSGLATEMLRGQARDAYEFIRTHYGEFGVLPQITTVVLECDIEPDFEPGELRVDEPAAYYAKKVVERAALNEQKKAAQGLRQALTDRDPNAVHETAKGIVQVGLECLTTLRGSVVNQKHNADERWARYQRLKSVEGGVVGFNTPWAAMDEATGGWRDGALITAVARLGLGKCVAAGTLVTDPVSGWRVPIEDAVRDKLDVLTFSLEDPRVVGTTPSVWINTGRKDCIRIKTRLGEEIVVTPEHPFLTADGWVRADELAPGDLVATAARIPQPTHAKILPWEEVALLAILLSEGSYSGNHVSFSNADPAYVKMAKEVAAANGLDTTFDGKCTYALTRMPFEQGGRRSARKILKSYGIGRETSHYKRAPEQIFSLPDEALRSFLMVFWWGDGGVDGEITLASEGLIDDLKHLLLRFGVVAKKSYKSAKCGTKRFPAWRLRVESWTYDRFLEVVSGIDGEKGEALRAKISSPQNPNTDNVFISDERHERFKRAADSYRRWGAPAERRGLFVEAAKRLGVRSPRQYGSRAFGRKNGKTLVGRRALRALLDEAGSLLREDHWLVSDHVVFDVVSDSEDAGSHQVYDLTIPGTRAFVAEHLVVHNTWLSILNQVCCEKQGARVGFVSPEMTREAIELRRDAVNYRLPYRDLLKGELDFESEQQYHAALFAEAEGSAPDSFIAAEGYVTSVLDAELFAQEREIQILFVDGMYLLNPPGDNGRMAWHERVMHVVRSLKELALKMKIPVFATGQFNRDVRAGSMRAGTESIGHSDAIGQFSDIIIGMFQDENMRVSNQMMLSLLKNREGPPIELLSNWDLIRMDFSEIGVGGQAGADTADFEDDMPELF